jgi:hypothetical protein
MMPYMKHDRETATEYENARNILIVIIFSLHQELSV